MNYLKHKSGRATRLISLEGIRWVQCTRANPAGGTPNRDTGKIVYEDGYVLDVPFECAEAVQGALKGKTVPEKQKEATKEQSE